MFLAFVECSDEFGFVTGALIECGIDCLNYSPPPRPLPQTTQWLEIMQRLCLHDNPRVQHRGLVVIYNMLNSGESELAKKLIESEMLEILSVIGKAEDNPKRQEVIDVARTCLVKAMDLGLIKPFTTPS